MYVSQKQFSRIKLKNETSGLNDTGRSPRKAQLETAHHRLPSKFTSTRFGLKSVIRVSELTGLGKIDSLQLIQKSWGHMNKDINLLTSTVRQYSWGTRYLSWLDQNIFVLEENFIATELEHQGSSGVQDQSKGNRSGSDKASLLKINLYISALIPISSTLRVTQAFRLFCGEGGISCYCSHGLPLNDIKLFNLYIQN